MARIVRILHLALLGGMTLCGAVLYLVRRLLQAPTLEVPRLPLVFAVVPVLLLVAAATALRPRVPDRPTGQDADAYWSELGTPPWSSGRPSRAQAWSAPLVITSPERRRPPWRSVSRSPLSCSSGPGASKVTDTEVAP